jgi:large conductance mechanosensitive channel
MIKEFKAFISKGNVVDLAVGIIIGTAFTAIVSSLVKDIIMPIIAMIIGNINFTTLLVKINGTDFTYGNFIQAVVNFLIIAFVVFLLVKGLSKLHRPKKEEEEEPAPALVVPREEVLLEEIRDLLKEKK